MIEMFAICSFLLSVLVLGRDYKEKRLPKKINLENFNNYVNSEHHWNSVGHFLIQFMVVNVFGSISIEGIIFGCILSVGSAFFIEMVLQKNKLTNKDTLFDLATHILGTLAGLSLFL